MNIVHVVTSDKKGGAARAAFRISESINSLNNDNISSNLLVLKKDTNDERVIEIANSKLKYYFCKLKHFLNILSLCNYKNIALFSNDIFGNDISKIEIIKNADIINLHWVNAGMLSYDSYEKLKLLNKPIVWTLHDMAPFTGGCHYDQECNRYREQCGKCRVLQSKKEKDLSTKIQKKKFYIFNNMNLSIVGCSEWITECAKKSMIFKSKKCNNIPNPINTDVFNIEDKKVAREKLGIKTNKKVILFGAMSANSDKRKGYRYLIDAINKIDKDKFMVIIFGSDKDNIKINSKINIKYLGNINDDEILRLVYSSADVFVAPSIQENLANTVMESLACGTPVVAFNIGGMKDMIIHKKNGYLANAFNTNDLKYGIEYCSANKNLSGYAINYVGNKYSYKTVAEQYIEVYNKLLK